MRLIDFGEELQCALATIAPTQLLTRAALVAALGDGVFEKITSFRLSTYLEEQEEAHRFVIYCCDNKNSSWTRRCLRHADVILLVGNIALFKTESRRKSSLFLFR